MSKYSKWAVLFAKCIELNFYKNYRNTKFPDEIQQFQSLINAFNLGKSIVQAASYHGTVSQVEFSPNTTFVRPRPRCELADVLFVTYTDLELRITFLQAKSKKSKNPYPLWLANLEQYALLGLRPIIDHWLGPVVWPNDILTNAPLHSVGSFGVFHDDGRGYVCFDYISADELENIGSQQLGVRGYHQGLLAPKAQGSTRKNSRFPETKICAGLCHFALELYSMRIGSPIHSDLEIDTDYSLRARRALLTLLNDEKEKNDVDHSVLNDLMDSNHFRDLGKTEQSNFIGGVGAIVIIKGQSE